MIRLRSSEGWNEKSKPDSVLTVARRAICSAALTLRPSRTVVSSAIAVMLVRGAVADDPHLVEEIGNLGGNHALEFEAAKEIGLRFFWTRKKTRLCSGDLGEEFPKLPDLNQACARIIPEVALGKRAQPHELRVVCREKAKIGGGHRESHHDQATSTRTLAMTPGPWTRQPIAQGFKTLMGGA